MNVLIGCECSQVVCTEFRKLGHNAFSCDIQDCYGNHPEWHIKCDVLNVLPGNLFINTCDGSEYFINHWDLIIIHPPCTYLSKAGANRLISYVNGVQVINQERYKNMVQAAEFFYSIIDLVSPDTYLCIENPIPLKIAGLPEPSQHIQPYFFGDKSVKYTYLWLYNRLPPLMYFSTTRPSNCIPIVNASSKYPGRYNSAKLRSQTSPGIARAMALQWG